MLSRTAHMCTHIMISRFYMWVCSIVIQEAGRPACCKLPEQDRRSGQSSQQHCTLHVDGPTLRATADCLSCPCCLTRHAAHCEHGSSLTRATARQTGSFAQKASPHRHQLVTQAPVLQASQCEPARCTACKLKYPCHGMTHLAAHMQDSAHVWARSAFCMCFVIKLVLIDLISWPSHACCPLQP